MSALLQSVKYYWNTVEKKLPKNKFVKYGIIGYTSYFFGSIILARIIPSFYNYNTFTTVNQILKSTNNIAGKTFVITGGTSGLGKETAKILIKNGGNVHMLVRNIDKANQVKKEIANELKQYTHVNVVEQLNIMNLDLSSLNNVYNCAYNIYSNDIKIDYLINNAGVMAIPQYTTTKDGIEIQFGINYLGHYYLTKLLLPLLIQYKTRIINVSSITYLASSYTHGIQLFKAAYESKSYMADKDKSKYSAWFNYGISKACNIIMTRMYNKLYKNKYGIYSLSLHPGSIVTGLQRSISVIPGLGLPLVFIPLILFAPAVVMIEFKGYPRGLATLFRCITMSNDEIDNSLYKFYMNCNPTQTHNSLAKIEDNNNDDSSVGDKLFELSDNIIESKGFSLKIERNNANLQ